MTKSLQKRIGNAARKARVALELTQEDAAEQIGVTVEFYARIERGNALPGLKTFIRMAMVFETGADRLLGLNEDEQAQRILKEFGAKKPNDPPELRRLFRKLRRGQANRVRMANVLLHELDKFEEEIMGRESRSKKSRGGDKKSDQSGDKKSDKNDDDIDDDVDDDTDREDDIDDSEE